MGFIDRINRFLGLYLDTFKAIGRPMTWFPFLVLALMQFGILVILEHFVHPRLYPILRPLVDLLGEGRADFFSHYPELYLFLPTVYQWGAKILGILFEGLFLGISSVYFVRIYRDRDTKVSYAFRRWPQLIIIGAVITGILLLIVTYIPGLFSDLLTKSPRRAMAFEYLLRLAMVIIYTFFIYAMPALIVYRDGLFRAFVTSFKLFGRNPIFTFFLAFIPFLLSLPITYAIDNVTTLVDKFSPELVFYILAGSIVVGFVSNYFITGTVVKFMIDEREMDEG